MKLIFKLFMICAILVGLYSVGFLLHYRQIPYIGGTSFHDNFESGKLDGSLWDVDAGNGCEMRVVESPDGKRGKSLMINAEKGERCEILPHIRTNMLGKLGHEPLGVPVQYSFSIYIPKSQEFSERNEVLAQWHSAPDTFLGDLQARGPAVALRVLSNVFAITSGWDDQFISEGTGRRDRPLKVIPSELGKWVDWRFEVTWSYGDDGQLKVWKNSELILSHQGANTYNDLRNVYLKMGVYHPANQRQAYFDDIKIYVQK